jgi:hypothetical protein
MEAQAMEQTAAGETATTEVEPFFAAVVDAAKKAPDGG